MFGHPLFGSSTDKLVLPSDEASLRRALDAVRKRAVGAEAGGEATAVGGIEMESMLTQLRSRGINCEPSGDPLIAGDLRGSQATATTTTTAATTTTTTMGRG